MYQPDQGTGPFSPRPPVAPYSAPPRKLRRSRSNRRVAGVMGGLGEYLGVDATVLRVGMVVASLLIGGFGGPVLYGLAWLFVPEDGSESGVWRNMHIGHHWNSWDRNARSWALVLAAIALALIWWFGFWPAFRWEALPVWAVLTGLGVAVLLFSDRLPFVSRSGQRPPRSMAGPWGPPPGGPGDYPSSGPGGQWGPQGPPFGGSAGGAPAGAYAAPNGAPVPGAPVPGAPVPGAAMRSATGAASAYMPAPATRAPREDESDWVEAQSAASAWADAQLRAAGVPTQSSAITPPPAEPQRRRQRSGQGWTLEVVTVIVVLVVLVGGAAAVASNVVRDLRQNTLSHSMTSQLTRVAPRGGVALSSLAGDVDLAPSGDASVHYSASLSYSGARPYLTMAQSRGKLDLGLSCPGRCAGTLTVAVPTGTPVAVSAGSGDIQATGLSGPVQLEASSGDLNVSKLSGAISLSTESGDIDAEALSSARAQVQDQQGDISLWFSTPPSYVGVSAQEGDISVQVPAGAAYAVHAKAQIGVVSLGVRTSHTSRHVLALNDQEGDIDVVATL
ncbi:MAG TPA: PspC domain-containing protein [Acidimicrobiales bacterium]|nr:PspC domain-containing protein [Acidimicrobiales bacterium]